MSTKGCSDVVVVVRCCISCCCSCHGLSTVRNNVHKECFGFHTSKEYKISRRSFLKKTTLTRVQKHSLTIGDDGGSVGRVVASETRDPWFESSQRQILFTINCIEKTIIKKK